MDEPISRETKKAARGAKKVPRGAKKAAKALEALKEAENDEAVTDYLEIVEDAPQSLTLRVHRRKYKTKVTIQDWKEILYIILMFVGIIVLILIFNQTIYGLSVISVQVAIIIIAIVDEYYKLYKRYTVIVDKVGGVMKVVRHPFPLRKELALDHVAEFRLLQTYKYSVFINRQEVSRQYDKSVIYELNEGTPSIAEKKRCILKGLINNILVDVVVARLNQALAQYRTRREKPL